MPGSLECGKGELAIEEGRKDECLALIERQRGLTTNELDGIGNDENRFSPIESADFGERKHELGVAKDRGGKSNVCRKHIQATDVSNFVQECAGKVGNERVLVQAEHFAQVLLIRPWRR